MNRCLSQIQGNNKNQKPGWYYLDICDDLSDYYAWFARKRGILWQKPLNGAHMTFIAGEKENRFVSNEDIRSYFGLDIEVLYENQIWTDGCSFWVPSFSRQLDDIRRDLGLSPKDSYHITLGNLKSLGAIRGEASICG